MTGPFGFDPATDRLPGPVVRAVRLSIHERRRIFASFFTESPGAGRSGLGFGQALDDFLSWQVDSGRIREGGGSAWWRAVNGLLALDLAAAQRGARASTTRQHASPTAAWYRYRTAPPELQQRALWRAHDASLDRATTVAASLLSTEPPSERDFTDIVLRVVAGAAAQVIPTDGPRLDRSVREHYPATYPATAADVNRLVTSARSATNRRSGAGGPAPASGPVRERSTGGGGNGHRSARSTGHAARR